jgi:multidrug efflux system membrane fusion protein
MDSQDKLQTRPPHVQPKLTVSQGKSLTGIVLTIAGLAVLGGLSWYLTHRDANGNNKFGPGGPGGRAGGPATTVGVATAEKFDLPITLESLGTVTATATVTVTPQVSGKLVDILFKEGQLVKKGQLLARIDPRPFELALMQAAGQTKRDEASLDTARITLKRYSVLLEQDSVARQDYDTQASLVKQLEGTVLTDRASEGTAKLNLEYTRITSPVDGRVGLRQVDIGNIVNSSSTTGIAVIAEISPIDVEFSIPQDQVPQIVAEITDNTQQNGNPQASGTKKTAADKTAAHAGHDANDGKISVIAMDRSRSKLLGHGYFLALDNQIDTQTGTVKAKARFANEDSSLYPNQFVNTKLKLRTIKDAIVVPTTALRHSSKGDFVYVLNSSDPGNPTVSLRQVTSGQTTVDKVQISSGIDAGEKVITEGADRLKDGAKVKLPGDKPAGGKDWKSGKGDSTASSASASTHSGERHRKQEASQP